MAAVADLGPVGAEAGQAADLGGGVGGVEVEPGQAVEGAEGPGGVEVPDVGPPGARAASAIMAPKRPVEALAICRTSSIGATVPPAGHHHVHRHALASRPGRR